MPPKSMEELIRPEVESRKPTKYACTVVSLLPYEITETKPHMIPFTFVIAEADPKVGFSLTYVEEASHVIPNPFDDKHNYKQHTPPNEVARSLVEDYAGALIGISSDAKPGMFWVEGRVTAEEVKKTYAEELATAQKLQKNWFKNLIRIADADWEKTHNVLAASDIQRHAARSLNEKRPWVDSIKTEENTCPYCKVIVDSAAIKCHNCKEVINIEAYKAMQAKLGVSKDA